MYSTSTTINQNKIERKVPLFMKKKDPNAAAVVATIESAPKNDNMSSSGSTCSENGPPSVSISCSSYNSDNFFSKIVNSMDYAKGKQQRKTPVVQNNSIWDSSNQQTPSPTDIILNNSSLESFENDYNCLLQLKKDFISSPFYGYKKEENEAYDHLINNNSNGTSCASYSWSHSNASQFNDSLANNDIASRIQNTCKLSSSFNDKPVTRAKKLVEKKVKRPHYKNGSSSSDLGSSSSGSESGMDSRRINEMNHYRSVKSETLSKWFPRSGSTSGEDSSEVSNRDRSTSDSFHTEEEEEEDKKETNSITPSSITSVSQEQQRNSIEMNNKQEALLLFLLQHVCFKLNPDPAFFKNMCEKLLEKKYLKDPRCSDPNFLKLVCKEFTADLINNWPLSTPEKDQVQKNPQSALRRSESFASFLSNSGNDLAAPHYNRASVRKQIFQSISNMPFFNYPFYSKSRFETDWGEKEIIGRGAFGIVYKSRHLLDGHEYAIKQITFSFSDIKEREMTCRKILREVKLLATLDHPNVVRYNQAWFEISKTDDHCNNEEGNHLSNGLSSVTLKIGKENNSHNNEDSENEADNECSLQNRGIEEAPDSPYTPSIINPANVRFEVNSDEDSLETSIEQPLPTEPFENVVLTPKDVSYLELAMKKKEEKMKRAANNNNKKSGYDDPIVNHSLNASECRNELRALTNLFSETLKNDKVENMKIFLFIQMQLCAPHTLEDYLWSNERVKAGKINYLQCLLYFKQLVEGVLHIHSKSLIHRDLKPKNIFISKDNQIKIGDFGLAKLVKAQTELSSTTNATDYCDGARETQLVMRAHSPTKSELTDHTKGVGTFLYASPEQYEGTKYDGKSDIFSLGIILYEMLHPFSTKAERAHVLMELRNGNIQADKIEQYPEEMELVRRCTEKSPENRPSSNELLAIVKNILANAKRTTEQIEDTKIEVSNNQQPSDVYVQLLKEKDNEIYFLKKELERLRKQQQNS
jgi:serine/threonine protein kinase